MLCRWMSGLCSVAVLPAIALIALIATEFASVPASAEEDTNPLKVGVLTSPAPYYSFSEVTGEPIGFALSMWIEVARRAGVSYQLVFFDSLEELRKAAAARAIDVVPLLVKDARSAEIFDFTQTVHRSPVSVFVRKNNSGINRIDDLAGHRVSVVEGHLGQVLMRTFRGELSISHENADEALSTLITRTSDAVVYQEHILRQLARQRGVESLLKTVGRPMRTLDMAIAVRKGLSQLLAELDSARSGYMSSSKFYSDREPWGGNPPPLIDPNLIAKILGVLLALAIVGLGLWRHFSIIRLNKALEKSIAEQKSAEARFKDLAESASDWFFEQDANFRFTFISSRFEDLTGVPSSRLIGRTRWDEAGVGDPEHDDAKWREHIETVKAHEDWRDFTYSLVDKDGAKRTVTTSGKAIYDADGQFAGYRGTGRDITRRIELEDALHQAQKMELVGQLTGGIAHDFNNLLTVMIGNLEMLKRNLKPEPRTSGYLETTLKSVEIGSQLVQRLLGFSRRQSLNPGNADLNELITGMMQLVRSSLGPSIEIELQLGSALPPVFADAAQLQNALLNLAINARDAMPDGGKLMIGTEEVNVDETFTDQHPGAIAGRFIALQVRDAGCGIAKADLAKVLEPFFTTKEVGKGSGLGLSTVYGFARQSGGFLLIDSELNAGTRVSIHLPVGATPDAALTADQPRTECAQANNDAALLPQTLLVVEDDPRVRDITVARLQHLGYHVLDAASAAEALEKVTELPAIDLIVTDINMPGGMSGIELAQQMRSTRPDIKILFSAAYSEHAGRLEEQGKLGPWLRKPYKQAELDQKVREVLAT